MRINKRILSIIVISLLAFSTLSIFWAQLLKVSALGMGSFTGTIYDSGVDTDIDGTFDFLEVGVEVSVSTAGVFQLEIFGLYDSEYNHIGVGYQISTYLDVGVQVVYLSLGGPSIYASGLDPVNVSSIELYDEYGGWLDYLSDVPLSREYDYTEFDPPPTFLTGTIYDRGLDIDGDGAFDYLEVDVEVNVADSGDYDIEIRGLLDSGHNYTSVLGHKSEYLDVGTQLVNVSLYGPTIYVSGLNPVNVSKIELWSVEYGPLGEESRERLGSVYDAPLSKKYFYTEFDSPFADIEAIFVVYPDGRVVIGGTLNYTHMEPPNTGPSVYGVASIEKSGALTLLSADFSLVVPPEEASQFPFNSSAFTLLSEYSSDLLTVTINGSTILPPSIASEFPFNVTDFTVKGEYIGDMVTGNVTLDILSGFPLEDIDIDFQGNNTYVYLNGSTTVVFGNYPDIELNATVLDDLLQQLNNTIPGQGPDSLYNMTQGLFECTRLNTTTTPYDAIGATVDFEAEFRGDLIQTFVYISGQPAFMYEMLNATLPSVEGGSFVLTYAHALKEADMDLVFAVNMTELIDSIVLILPEIHDVPPELVSFIESVLNTTYCTVDSAQVSLDYDFGQATLTANATIQDFNAEINYLKSLFLTYNSSQPWTSQLQILNDTQIDLANFRISIDLTETSLEADVSGFAVLPPLDWINATSFKLERFFNITASEDEPPGEGERLNVAVEGGSNGTHTVRISRPLAVPEPDITALGGMVWNNQSISGLKDLVFLIGPLDDVPPVIGTPIHIPETPDDSEEVTVSVNVTDSDTGVRHDGVILSYSTNGGDWKNVTMSKATGDTYEGIIPGLPAGTQVRYMIIARDYAGNEVVDNNEMEYYVFTVIPEFPTWQIVVLTLFLIGIIVIIAKRRRNIAGNSSTANQLFSVFAGKPMFHQC